jgi:hypothetical protein
MQGRTESPEVPLERLEARICSLAAQLASSTCEWLRLVAEFDRRKGWAQWGLKSCAHWLSWSCSVSAQAAREYLRVAKALEDAPLIRDAFAAGRLSFSKVKAVTRVVGLINEQTLLDQALLHTAAQLERVVRAFRKTESAGPSRQEGRKARWFWDDDGMLVFTARLPADEGAMLVAALRMAEQSLSESPESPEAQEKSANSQTIENAADAVVALAQNALAAGPVDSSGDDRHLLVLHIDAEVLGESSRELSGSDQQSERRCHLEDGPGLDLPTAERLICDAAVMAVVRSSLGPTLMGEPLRLGHKTRKISPALRRALRIRDGGCQHPGCHRRRHLQAHHVVHWKDGGPTNLENLVLLCRFHHMQVHEDGVTVAFASPVDGGATTGGWVFHRPDGVPIPATRDLLATPAVDAAEEQWDPSLIHTDGGGQGFSLAESVGVFCRAADSPDFKVDLFGTRDELLDVFKKNLYPDWSTR